jgi:hypothetical protein
MDERRDGTNRGIFQRRQREDAIEYKIRRKRSAYSIQKPMTLAAGMSMFNDKRRSLVWMSLVRR